MSVVPGSVRRRAGAERPNRHTQRPLQPGRQRADFHPITQLNGLDSSLTDNTVISPAFGSYSAAWPAWEARWRIC